MLLSVKPQDRVGNKLLAALPREEYKRILPDLEQISFSFGESIYESSERSNYAYFPITSVVSLVYTMLDGASAEMGMVGNEGLIGIALFTGGETRPNRAIVQHAGGHQDEGACLSGRVQAWWLVSAFVAALYTGAAHPGFTESRVQRASLHRTATCLLAADDP